MNKDIINLRENILSALPLSMAKKYERMNRDLNNNINTFNNDEYYSYKIDYYYRNFKPIFDKAFGKDEKGRLIYRKYINIDNMKVDKEIQTFLKDNGYSITEEEFNAGIIIKNKDDKNNKYSLDELKKKGMVLRIGRILNKKKAPQNLILKWDRISKEISNKKLIVISRHPYDIAGQSTDRSWESCMTLQTDKQRAGCNSHFVDSGIRAGVLIAYLINNTDTNINKPLARVLIKPYINEENKKIYFNVSKIYGVAGNEFKNTVQKWVDKNLNKKSISGNFSLNNCIYNDEEKEKYITYLDKNYIINTSNKILYNKYNVVFDYKNNTLYTVKDNNIKTLNSIKKEFVSKILYIHKYDYDMYYDTQSNTLYTYNAKRLLNSVLLIDDEVITDFNIGHLLYNIDEKGYIQYEYKYVTIIDNTIYINKKYKNDNYKGIDYSNSYKIAYTDKYIATDNNIKKLVKDLSISLRDIDTSNVTNMNSLFSFTERDNYDGIENWNVSNVRYMNNMFKNSPLENNTPHWYKE